MDLSVPFAPGSKRIEESVRHDRIRMAVGFRRAPSAAARMVAVATLSRAALLGADPVLCAGR
ncbi:hypothetical protein DF3PA_130045 [Candidatus Defluviicoccus seviourii]|uniref:Uncharacterized protein n=1 Tax=Candidatus Defluviicoccus seviourii TaxID=2565273 RepID=A0A564WAM1_9PROT|nr:hypothetical protein DF3PA_130045 [Candidatus Defluviicoccus seviourii]